MIFFNPDREMLQWLLYYANGRKILEVGAGEGFVTKSLNALKPETAVGIDLFNADFTAPVYMLDATTSELVSKCPANWLVLMCRPSHGVWVPRTITRLNGPELLYIGLERNLDDDLWGFEYKAVSHLGDSEDGERVWSLKTPQDVEYEFTSDFAYNFANLVVPKEFY